MLHKRSALIAVVLLAVPSITLWAQVNPGNISAAAAPIPLASHPQGQAMMAQAVQSTTLLDVNFKFLDKEYENDTYATDPLGNKYRTGCYRFKATSGYRFKVDQPQFTLNQQGLTIRQNIASLNVNGLTAKGQVLVCQEITLPNVGFKLSNVQLTYRVNPVLSYNQSNGACTLGWSAPNLNVTIGDLNIQGVQNDIDQLAKKAVQEAVNFAFDVYYGSAMRGELLKITTGVCGAPTQSQQPGQTQQSIGAPATRRPTR